MLKRAGNQKGFTLIELLAAVVILALIIGPLLSISFSSFRYTAEDGERNQTVHIAQLVMEAAKQEAKETLMGQACYQIDELEYISDPSAYDDYDMNICFDDFTYNTAMQQIYVTVQKKNSSMAAVELKTVVRKP